MKKILVTGSKGQLGNEINKLSTLYPNFKFFFTDIDELDITDFSALEKYFSINNPDFIINCAAFTNVDKAESEKEKAESLNSIAVRNLRSIAEKHDIYLIHISTDYVFDGRNYRPYDEDDPVNPVSVYGSTKLNGERELYSFQKAMIIRTSWLYSSFGNNFVKTIMRLGNEKPELKVVFDQIGTPTYAADLANAILTIIHLNAKNEMDFKPGIYHYSNEGVCSWFDFALEIVQLAGLKCKILPINSSEYPTIAIRPFYSVLNKSKIKSTFTLQIPHWKDGLIRCMNVLK